MADAAAGTTSEQRDGLAEVEVAAVLEELAVVSEDLRQQNRALAQVGRRYEEMFQFAPEPYLVTDAEGVIRRANRAATHLLGVDQEVLAGKPLVLFVEEERRSHFYAQLTLVQENEGRKRWRTRLTRKATPGRSSPLHRDGLSPLTEADLSVAGLRDDSGRLTTLHWIIRGVGGADQEERTAGDDLREERDQRLNLVSQVSRELSAALDVESVAERLLREVTTVIGAEGASVWLWDERREGYLACRALFHAGKDLSAEGLLLAPDEGVAGWSARHGESVIVNSIGDDARFCGAVDGRTGIRTHSLIAAPLRVRDKILGAVEVVNGLEGGFDGQDLFLIETLAASAAVAIDNAHLVRELEARNEDLQAFGHTVAHDIKHPLGLVVGYAATASQSFGLVSEDEMMGYLEKIERHGLKTARIVDELLLLAEVRGREVPIDVLDMREVLADVEERLAQTIDGRGAEIEAPEAWPPALGYAPWVEEVWFNYVENALKYGGDPPRIELGAENAGAMVRFSVRDHGPGIAPEAQEELFLPFARQSSGTGGHGLGLSIVQRIAETLGGRVGVESALGQGCTFWFTLPAASAD
jgi:PAS domain S-box-containing protein